MTAPLRDLAQWRHLAAQAASAHPVPSPCVSLCRMQALTGTCEGCGRNLDEITQWSRLDDADKRRIWATLPLRQQALQQLANTAEAPPQP